MRHANQISDKNDFDTKLPRYPWAWEDFTFRGTVKFLPGRRKRPGEQSGKMPE